MLFDIFFVVLLDPIIFQFIFFNRNGGYFFVGLCRCKACAIYFVPQCFTAKCGKCAGDLRTESCRSKISKCVNCIKGNILKHPLLSTEISNLVMRWRCKLKLYFTYNHKNQLYLADPFCCASCLCHLPFIVRQSDFFIRFGFPA